jgi:hypothetical protein
MPQRLSKEECYRRAEEARGCAEQERNPKLKQDFLDIVGHWISLAHSYEFTSLRSNFRILLTKWNAGPTENNRSVRRL